MQVRKLGQKKVYCAGDPLKIYQQYQIKKLPKHKVFDEANHPEGKQHVYRGMRAAELNSVLRPKFSIGPHDQDIALAAGHHEILLGFWISPSQQAQTRREEHSYPVGLGLTPNALDFRSKIILIEKFGLEPRKPDKWAAHFDSEWQRAYQALKSNSDVAACLAAEKMLDQMGISRSVLFPFLEHLDPIKLNDSLMFLKIHLEGFVGALSVGKFSIDNPNLYPQDRARIERALRMRQFNEELVMTAFLPVPENVDTFIKINTDNFKDAFNLLRALFKKTNLTLLKGILMEESPLFNLLRYHLGEPEPVVTRTGYRGAQIIEICAFNFDD